jgi:hypothetical protein
MANPTRAVARAVLLAAGLVLAGCSGEGTDNIFTGSLASNNTQNTAAPEPKVDPACVSLVNRIDALRREGIGDKIEKAAAKRYRMTQADLGKADQLTKANAEFQMRCSTVTPSINNASMPPPVTPPPAAPAKTAKKAAAATP